MSGMYRGDLNIYIKLGINSLPLNSRRKQSDSSDVIYALAQAPPSHGVNANERRRRDPGKTRGQGGRRSFRSSGTRFAVQFSLERPATSSFASRQEA